jgi:bacteriocin biosynthesis cyclodehydratase domain-containing protein
MDNANPPIPRLQRIGFISIDQECSYIYNLLESAIAASVTRINIVELDISTSPKVGIRPIPFDAFVIASSRPAESAFTLTANAARRLNATFVPISFPSGHICIGPVIVPRNSACWTCWLKRRLQHDNHPQESEAIRRFYDRSSRSFPPIIQPLLHLAACRLANIFSSNDSLSKWAGHIWHFNPHLFVVQTGTLAGTDGCPHCGLGRTLEERTYKDLQGWARSTYAPVPPPGRVGKGC